MDAFLCPNCAVRLMVPDQLAGTHIDCPECEARVAVPSDFDPERAVRRGSAPTATLERPVQVSTATSPRLRTEVDIHDMLPRDPTDDGRLRPWRVSQWIGLGGMIVFGGAALLLLCLVHGYRQIQAVADAAVKPPAALAIPKAAVLIPPPPVRVRRGRQGPARRTEASPRAGAGTDHHHQRGGQLTPLAPGRRAKYSNCDMPPAPPALLAPRVSR